MKNLVKIIKLVLNSILHPSHIVLIIRDLKGKHKPTKPDNEHLDAAIDWLCRAQDVSKGGGCAGVYTFESGWLGPYPETTGYIIPTFIRYAELKNDNSFIERAIKMGDWELSIQLDSGAVRGGVGVNKYPIVFNTGQVMLGWVALYKKLTDEKYLKAATKAAEWLVGNQDEDGKWGKNTYNNIPHAYNVRVTWALFEVASVTNNSTFQSAAEKNVKWVLSQANEKSWFNFMGFTLEEQPLTHTIAYTLRGLLECSAFVNEELRDQILKKVINASEYISEKHKEILSRDSNTTRGFIPGTLDNNWNSSEKYSCLTGDAQLAIIWMKLYLINGNKAFLDAAHKNIEQVKFTQSLTCSNGGIRGGIAGSYPVWGKYTNFGYPNWAAKFFADAIMIKQNINNGEAPGFFG